MSFRKKIIYFDVRDWIYSTLRMRRWGMLDICPTWKCNAKCPTCGAWKRKRHELTLAQTQQLVYDKHFSHLNHVYVEGGEPTLWTHLNTYLDMFLTHRPHALVNIITNGFRVDFLEDLGNNFKSVKDNIKFYISLNGDRETHDASRGVKHAYDRTLASAKLLKSMGYFVQFPCVVFDQNLHAIDHVYKVGEEMGCPIGNCFSTDYGRFKMDEGRWTTERQDEIKAVYRKASSQLKFLDKWSYDYFLDYAFRNKIMPCYGGYRYVHVDPNGELRPCLFDESMKIGQLTDTGVVIDEKGFKAALNRIPNECQYTGDQICDDCLLRKSIRSNILGTVLWKIRKSLS